MVEPPASATGHDIVTSSGDTLLGADDKAGVAEIMTAVAHLAAHPELPRPTLRICFTPDEEIGEGATLFDVERFGAVCAYTLDGSDLGELQDETFSAEEVIAHDHTASTRIPGWAKDVLVNATRLASEIVAALPDDLTPERTDGRDGFIHVYEIEGSGGKAVRARDRARLRRRQARTRTPRSCAGPPRRSSRPRRARESRSTSRRSTRTCTASSSASRRRSRRPRRRSRAEGIELVRTPIRGGTDGSRLSAMGLPTPNLFTGGHDYHSPREWASLQEMAAAAATVVRLAEAWARDGAPPPR